MIALVLCGVAFLACYKMGRRSLVEGLGACLVVGYFYGIVRANVPSTLSHFIFDAGALGLFAAVLFQPTPEQRQRNQALLPWVAALVGWPALLLLLPIQDPMVQLVGLRAHVFMLPFILLGARLSRAELSRLAVWIGVLNLVAFAFALAEFTIGVERFYPRNAVTELIYRSQDVGINVATMRSMFRIPAIFANSSAYAGTMVVTMPLLISAWIRRPPLRRERYLFAAAVMCSLIGVFMAASRTHFMVLAVLLLVTTLSTSLPGVGRLGWVFILGAVGWLVSTDYRFQRFMSIDPQIVIDRVSISVNDNFWNLAVHYPLGNGLGGGGTSLPYFLLHLVKNPVAIENQYGTIMLEQGVPGLVLWAFFLAWVFTRRARIQHPAWAAGHRLLRVACAAYYATGLIGLGLFTSVPFTAILFMATGWIAVQGKEEELRAASALPQHPNRATPPAGAELSGAAA